MDHKYIEQSDLIIQYLIGRLPAKERERFEEHLIDCSLCIDQLNTTRDIRQGLRLLTVQQTAQAESVSPKVSRWAFLQTISWKTVALAACCLLLAALVGSVFLLNRTGRLRSEAEQAKTASLDWQSRYEEQQQSALLSEQQRQQTEQGLREQVRQLDAELQNEQNLRASEAGKAQDRLKPEINMPGFVFNAERSNGQNPSSGVREVPLPGSRVNFSISIPLEGESGYKTYRFSIFAGSRVMWSGSGFTPDNYNLLRIGLNSKHFPPGDYLLKVEGIAGPQGSGIIGNYRFRVVRSS